MNVLKPRVACELRQGNGTHDRFAGQVPRGVRLLRGLRAATPDPSATEYRGIRGYENRALFLVTPAGP